MSQTFQRFLDLLISTVALVILLPFIIILIVVGYFDTGSPIFIQRRVGRNKKEFNIIKFRTMKIGTQSVGTHLVDHNAITKFGNFLRATKVDELPQLVNVILGDMSLVGYRPCLPNQKYVISERDNRDVFDFRPGVTGLAQINKIDMSTPVVLAEHDIEMFKSLTLTKYFKYLVLTALGSGRGDRVKK
ncbi:sugar transferase [Vibrio chagasii]|uniref:sugar transferase n=1 Tax=Vibrio chagasii TaxID=170679 RepID=UPI003DA1675C